MYQKKQSFAYKNMPYLSSFVGERGLKRAGFSSWVKTVDSLHDL